MSLVLSHFSPDSSLDAFTALQTYQEGMKVLKTHEITLKTIYEENTIPTAYEPQCDRMGLRKPVGEGSIGDGSRFSEEKMNSLLTMIDRFVNEHTEQINRQANSPKFAAQPTPYPRSKPVEDPAARILQQYISDCRQERERRRETHCIRRIENMEGNLANERLSSDRSLCDRLVTGSGWYSDSDGRIGFVVSWGSSHVSKEQSKRETVEIDGASPAI